MLNTDKYKKLLDQEKKRLEGELAGIAEKNPADKTDWIPTPPSHDEGEEADPIDAADAIEEYVERIGIEVPLEEQLRHVLAALDAIKSGTYGNCNIGGTIHVIEEERLDANPSASTCIAHMNS